MVGRKYKIYKLWKNIIKNVLNVEKKKKYQKFLDDNEWKFDWFFDKDWKRVLYKIVAEFKF